MITTVVVFVIVQLLGSILGSVIFPHMSWRGVVAGAAGVTAAFGVLTGVMLLIMTVSGPLSTADASPLTDTLSGAGLISSLAGE